MSTDGIRPRAECRKTVTGAEPRLPRILCAVRSDKVYVAVSAALAGFAYQHRNSCCVKAVDQCLRNRFDVFLNSRSGAPRAFTMSAPGVPIRKLGSQGLEASAQGLGCMGMSWVYKSAADTHAGEEESIKTIHRALELGVSFLDTSDVYGPFTNEELVGASSM